MMSHKLMCSAVSFIALTSQQAPADIVGYVLDYSLSTDELNIVRIYVEFDSPEDRLLNVGGSAISSFGPLGFYQHPLGGDTAPHQSLVDLDPTVAWDSFVTIGLEEHSDNDATFVDPDFDSQAFNTAGQLIGGWYAVPPTGSQGLPDADGLVLISKLSTFAGEHPGFSGTMFTFSDYGNGSATPAYFSISGPLQIDDVDSSALGVAGQETANFTITNAFSEPIAFGLGAHVSLGTVGPPAADNANNTVVTIDGLSTQVFPRVFDIPPLGPVAGPYLKMFSTWDVDENGVFTQHYQSHIDDEIIHVSRPRFGTTVLIHGDLQQSPSWMQVFGEEIIARANNGTVVSYSPLTGQWEYVAGSLDPAEELVLLFAWPEAWFDYHLTKGMPTAAAESLEAALRDPDLPTELEGVDLLGAGLHVLGYRRGAVVASELAKRLGLDGISVDHVTYLLPEALDGSHASDADDPNPKVWPNVGWADNYYKPGISSPTSQILGAYNEIPGGNSAWLWYRYTIDLVDEYPAIDREYFYGPDLGWNSGYFWSDVVGGPLIIPRPPVYGNPSDFGTSAPRPFNGDFELGGTQLAGWVHHGGSAPALNWHTESVNGDSNNYMQLSEITSATGIHNRVWIGFNDVSLRFDTRADVELENDLRVLLIAESDAGVTTIELMNVEPPTVSTQPGWITYELPIPLQTRNRSVTISFTATEPKNTPVDIDALELITQPFQPADLNQDGTVGPPDLASLLTAWGTCPDGDACPADIAPGNGDGFVNAVDLAALLAAWE